MPVKIGIDFGGTKTEIIALDGDNGKELYRKRIPTAKNNYDLSVSGIKDLVEEAESHIGQKASVGMGMTGCIDRHTLKAKNANTTWLNGKPLLHDLNEALKRNIRIENDANCFAVSEAIDGAGTGHDVVFGAILGTGCGGGIVIHQKLIQGMNNIAGEWGSNPLPYPVVVGAKDQSHFFNQSTHENDWDITHYSKDKKWNEHPGEVCFCGKRGCLDTWISGTGFKMDYHRVEKEDLSTHDIIANAKQGEEKALSALDRYTDRIARALSVVINILDPDIIVLGGGMSNVDEIYDMVPQKWGEYIDSEEIHTIISPPRHGDSSGVRGAAWLWDNAEHHLGLPK
ncbi:MAG: ROK family protein [Alphaproteobacteria bacterium]|nr:ROK family protein [Alphaproteobacteria bacterium]